MSRFIEGPAGTGKTTRAVQQVVQWLQDGVAPHEILVLVPQRTLGKPYQAALAGLEIPNATAVPVVTLTGLAQRAISLYWSLAAPHYIPEWDGRDPIYLNIETAQYHMAHLVEPVVQAGLFDGISLPRPRLVAQLLDTLSKAAMNEFPLAEVPERLSAAWVGHSSRLRVYRTAADVVQSFRAYCQQHALLDFSLQIEIFSRFLLEQKLYDQYARQSYKYLVVDNLEENYPVAMDFINWLWGSVADALLIYDTDGGYRLFLGAAPETAHDLLSDCDSGETLSDPLDQAVPMQTLVRALQAAFIGGELPALAGNPQQAFTLKFHTFYPQMIDWVSDQVVKLVQGGVQPREIVILAPFLGDALRFSLFNRLEAAGIPYMSHRPSRAIKDEPAAQAALTLLALAYQTSIPRKADVVRALMQVIAGLDPIRADLLVQVVYRNGQLTSFDDIKKQEMQSRITYTIGERYEKLRQWLLDFQPIAAQTPPDHFLQHLFDFAAQDGYRFHVNLDAGRVIAEMIESARTFREVTGLSEWQAMVTEYTQLISEGLLAAVHDVDLWLEEQNAVFIAPAYTFLMRNRIVDYQFWMDAGSNAWSERLEQPLTHPYVLQRDYPNGEIWTDDREYESQQTVLRRVILGLARRCRQQVYVAFSDLGEQGFEQRGGLLRLFNYLMQVNPNEIP